MRSWSWRTIAALALVVAANCLDSAPSQGASAQTKAGASTAPAAGEPAKAGKTDAKPAAEKTTHEFIFEHIDRMVYRNKTEDYELTGNIVVRHEDGLLRAQSMRWNSDTKKGIATGDLSFANKETTVTANRMEIDFNAREAVFKGDVRLVSQKKPAAKNAPPAAAPTPAPKVKAGQDEAKPFKEYWQDRTEIRCPELVYNYRADRAEARGGVTAQQKDRTGSAETAVYDNKAEVLVMTGKVAMTDEKKQTFHADKITVSLAEDWMEAEGVANSRFLVEDEKEKPADQAQPAAK